MEYRTPGINGSESHHHFTPCRQDSAQPSSELEFIVRLSMALDIDGVYLDYMPPRGCSKNKLTVRRFTQLITR